MLQLCYDVELRVSFVVVDTSNIEFSFFQHVELRTTDNQISQPIATAPSLSIVVYANPKDCGGSLQTSLKASIECFVKIVSVWEYEYIIYLQYFSHSLAVTVASRVAVAVVSQVSYRVITYYIVTILSCRR